jgi:hypothetical protein
MRVQKIFYYYKNSNSKWNHKILVCCEGLSNKVNDYLIKKLNNQPAKVQSAPNDKLLRDEIGANYKEVLGFNLISKFKSLFSHKTKVKYDGSFSKIDGGGVDDNLRLNGSADDPETDDEEEDDDDEGVDIKQTDFEKLESIGDIKNVDIGDVKFEEQLPLGKTFLNDESPLYFICQCGFFPEDTVMDFKQKINYLTNIPLYRQHFYFYNEIFKANPLLYTISELHKININSDYNFETGKFENKDLDILNTKVKFTSYTTITYDAFHLVTNYEYLYLVDMADIIDLDIRNKLSDNELLFKKYYYGFVRKFFPISSEEIFHLYVKHGHVSASFPSIEPTSIIQSYLKTQVEISRKANEEHFIKKDKISTSIKKFRYKVISQLSDNYIDLRLLFDHINTNYTEFDKVRFNDVIDGKIVSFTKTNVVKPTSVIDQISLSAILEPMALTVRIPIEGNNFMYIDLYQNCTYVVSAEWHNTIVTNFEENSELIEKYCKRSVALLEALARKCLFIKVPQNTQLIKKISSGMYLDLEMNVVWYQNIIAKADIAKFKEIIRSLVESKILLEKTTVNAKIGANTQEFYIKKCIYEFDVMRITKNIKNLNNFYSYLFVPIITNGWNYLFEKSRKIEIHNAKDFVSFKLFSIKINEFLNFMKYIEYIITTFEAALSYSAAKQDQKAFVPTRKINNLKIQDPKLYLPKDATGKVYSRICQLQKQPVIVKEQDIKSLPEKDRAGVVKYFNFTKKTPEFYRCPNSKYPHISTISGKHPEGYCYLCCSKNDINTIGETSKTNKKEIFEECMKTGVFKGTKIKNREIERINKFKKNNPVTDGRLNYLPYPLNKILVYNEIMLNDDKNKIFYVMGIKNEDPIREVMAMAKIPLASVASSILEYKPKFYSLLDGKILKFFQDPETLAKYITEVDKGTAKKLQPPELHFDVMTAIIETYLNIQFIVFSLKENDTTVKIPKYIGKKNGLNNRFDYVLLFADENRYYPIVLVDMDRYSVYKRNIDQIIFNHKHLVISTINEIIMKNVESSKPSVLPFDIFYEFCLKSNYNITEILINGDYECTGVYIEEIERKNKIVSSSDVIPEAEHKTNIKDTIFMPLNASKLNIEFITNDTCLIFSQETTLRVKYSMEERYIQQRLNNILKLIIEFNKFSLIKNDIGATDELFSLDNEFIDFKSKKLTTPLLQHIKFYSDELLDARHDMIIGISFIVIGSNELLFFIKPEKRAIITDFIQKNKFFSSGKYSIIPMPKSIIQFINKEKVPNKRLELLYKGIYKHHSYYLFLNTFVSYIQSNLKNSKVLNDIEKFLNASSSKENFDNDKKVISIHKSQAYATVREIILTNLSISNYDELDADIMTIINNFKTNKLMSGKYFFNNIEFYKLIKQNNKDLIKQYVKKIMDDRIIIKKYDEKSIDEKTSNILPKFCEKKVKSEFTTKFALETSNLFCAETKIMIESQDLYDKYIDILSTELLNPYKRSYILSPYNLKNVISNYRFIKYPNEKISVRSNV